MKSTHSFIYSASKSIKCKRGIFLLVLLAYFPNSFASNTNEELLVQLDKEINIRDIYVSKREEMIEEIKKDITQSIAPKEKYKIYSQLFKEYLSFQLDSARIYAEKKVILGESLKDKEKITSSKLNLAEIYIVSGLYKESLDMLQSTDRDVLDQTPRLLSYYYYVYCTIYRYTCKLAITDQQKKKYDDLLYLYSDSLVNTKDVGTNSYAFAKANCLILRAQYEDAFGVLYSQTLVMDPNDTQLAYTLYLMSTICELQNKKEEEQKYLIMSAICDIKNAKKEYASFYRLAYLLHLGGDIDRAYLYIIKSMEDAMYSNSGMMLIKISQILPIISNDYQTKTQKQKKQFFIFFLSISILSILLLFGLIYIYKQMQRVKTARGQLKITNLELNDVNERLEATSEQLLLHLNEFKKLNMQMSEMNKTLLEANYIKETYIIRYMDLCSEYIDRMDTYLNRIKKLSVKGDLKALNNELNPTQYIRDSLELFYNNFDSTFLHLFPSFVEDFNNLLKDKIDLKEGELLNPELRIYALIRLGVADNLKISRFLRYSLSTIYNYRTQVRNKAMIERSEFEKTVMKIGGDDFSN